MVQQQQRPDSKQVTVKAENGTQEPVPMTFDGETALVEALILSHHRGL